MDETARLKAAEAERAMRAMQAELARSEAAEAMKAAPELPAAAGVDQPGNAGVSRALLDIARDRDELAMLAAPSIESEPEPGEVGASHSPEPTRATLERPAIDDQAEPVVRTVYYATDRARVERRPLDLAWPFALPGALLMGTLGCLPLARRFIKDAYQPATRLLVVSVGGLAVLATTGLALQNVVQADQRDHMLAVQYGTTHRDVDPDGTPYERGQVQVSIPSNRAPGEVPRPNLVRFEFYVDPMRHFQLKAIDPGSRSGFYAGLREAVAADPDGSAFVFVHGFHNTFEDAAFRTAQIAHDMEYAGAPVFFSWPSQGSLDYLTEAENVKTSAANLRRFLGELHEYSGASRIHLIAHSMGSRAFAEAVEHMDAARSNRFGRLIFAAPDIRRKLLAQKIDSLDGITEGVTLYASSNDAALVRSRVLQGRDVENYQRAGETTPIPMIQPPMQTVDVSGATDGHSYISNSPAMIAELRRVFRGEPEHDGLYFVRPEGYWRLRGARDQ